MEFKDRLKDLRLGRGWTQQEVADKVGLHKMSISQYESGNKKPSFEMLESLADAFNVDMNYLLGYTDVVIRLSGDDTDIDAGINAQLSPFEIELVKAYRHSSKDMQRMAAYALGLTQEDNRCEE